MLYFFALIIFLLGLIIGSFINCLVYRLYVKKSFWRGRSFCPQCQKTINWYDNIPLLSFILLRARCRHCHKPISWQYPLVEFITGLLFLIVFLATILPSYHPAAIFSGLTWLTLARHLVFTAFLIIIFLYDLKYYLIIDKITLPAIVLALVVNLGIAYAKNPELNSLISQFLNFLISIIIATGFFLAQFIISRGKWIGGGDIRLGALMGAMLGWPHVIPALFLAYIVGAVVGLGLLIAKRATPKSQVPFGTFLTLATFIIMLWGEDILAWYLGVIF